MDVEPAVEDLSLRGAGKSVVVVGAGVAGLATVFELRAGGHEMTGARGA